MSMWLNIHCVPAVAAAFVAASLYGASLASAQSHPCQSDREQYCAFVEMGGGRVYKCLKENKANLSEACAAEIDSMQSTIDATKDACHEDAYEYCSDPLITGTGDNLYAAEKMLKDPGEGRVAQCLLSHQDKISDACKAQLEDLAEKFKAPSQ